MVPPKKGSDLSALIETADEYRTHKANIKECRARLDNEVQQASASGSSYRQIAEAAGLSVAWVQTALLRAGSV